MTDFEKELIKNGYKEFKVPSFEEYASKFYQKQCIEYQKALDGTMSEKMDLEDIIKKSITEINIIMEIITEQPSKDSDFDSFILQKLKGVLYVLEGKWNNE